MGSKRATRSLDPDRLLERRRLRTLDFERDGDRRRELDVAVAEHPPALRGLGHIECLPERRGRTERDLDGAPQRTGQASRQVSAVRDARRAAVAGIDDEALEDHVRFG